MGRPVNPHAMSPPRPGATRTAPPQMPAQYWTRGRYLPYILFGSCGFLIYAVAFEVLHTVWILGNHDPAAWEAHLARACLEAEGIHAIVADEHFYRLYGALSGTLGGVRLQVRPEEAELAAELLRNRRPILYLVTEDDVQGGAAEEPDEPEALVTIGRFSTPWEAHLAKGGKMLLTVAGAMSTAEMGIVMAELIRRGKVHGICCTGANLEEDVFNLVAHNSYERVPHFRELTAHDEAALLAKGLNRVTDTCIPEEAAMRKIENHMLDLWQNAEKQGEREVAEKIAVHGGGGVSVRARVGRSGRGRAHFTRSASGSFHSFSKKGFSGP